jgi:hypothetical protein
MLSETILEILAGGNPRRRKGLSALGGLSALLHRPSGRLTGVSSLASSFGSSVAGMPVMGDGVVEVRAKVGGAARFSQRGARISG